MSTWYAPIRQRINKLAPLVACTSFLLAQSGCGDRLGSEERQVLRLRDKEYVLTDQAHAKPFDLTGVEIAGGTAEEKIRIGHFLGRIPTNLPVTKVEVAWPEKPIAARVHVHPDYLIFLAKEKNGAWALRGCVIID